MARRIAVLQPSYLPWIGYFDQIARTDAFVFYDDVPFDKNGWRNRNRLRVRAAPGWTWVTVPVRLKGRAGTELRNIEISPGAPWPRKHLNLIRQSYSTAPYLKNYLGFFEEIYSRPWTTLCDLNIALIEGLCGLLGLGARFYRSSELGVPGGRIERLVALCRLFGAREYLTGDSARAYLEPSTLFDESGIRVLYQAYPHPVYRQCFEPFIPQLSILDLLLNVGPDSLALLDSEKRPREGVAPSR